MSRCRGDDNWVQLPPHVGDPLEVWVNGILQQYGVDYEQVGRELIFHRPPAQDGKLGFFRWASMFLGIAGTYRKHQTVDVIYEGEGRRLVETGLKVGG